ncbi:winged helix-turn-helix domain-containing protein [Arcobacter sp. YIC-310]|uniref:winged helix-turn-helix domain-containing protein n=1 Tax=Arcobacter sp. YIC-310 TaxID=3376632 RepID=UPI003C264B89
MSNIFINATTNIRLKSVLIINSNSKFMKDMTFCNKDNLYKMSFYEVEDFEFFCEQISTFDLIVFDNRSKRIKDFIKLFESKFSYRLNIPTILLESEFDENQIIYKGSNVYSVFYEPIDEKQLTLNISLFLNYQTQNQRLEFDKGFYFDISRDELFYDKKIVKLTRTEKSLIKLLIERKDELVTYESIEKIVWKNKNFSKYTLRNIVKHIREKTNESFIKNSSNRGYIINTL